MQIHIDPTQVPAGTLFSEWLEQQGLPTQGVTLDGIRVNPAYMLAAQAQGRCLTHSSESLDEQPLEAVQIAPDLVSAP
jgi:hypothetical protein